jgi:SWI/SNF-related matrix-associated actin-dependent regulator 1 of chromatin subfamily A
MAIVAEIDEKDPSKIKISEYEWKYKVLLNSIPSAYFHSKTSTWTYSLTWQTCLALQSTLKTNLTVGPKLQEWMRLLYGNTILPAYNMRMEITPAGWEDVMPDVGLYPHQKGDVAFLSTVRRGLLFNGMGSGKSISSTAAVRQLAAQGENVFPMLIACPNSTKMGWKKEILKVWPGLKINVIDGTATQRRKLLEEPAHVYVINWESIRSHSKLKAYGDKALKRCTECKGLDDKVKATSCEAHVKELNEIHFQTVIGDEIHRIKDPASKVARAFKAATGNAEFRIGLSGTPIANSPEDLFSPLNWLMPEAYPSRTKYIDRFCITADSAWGGKIVIGIRPEMEQEFFSGIDPFTRRMSKEVILPFLPPVVYERRDVEMGVKQAKAYNQMKEQMIAEVANGDVVYTTSPLTKMTRMLQFAASYAEVEYRDVYDPKLDAVVNKAIVRLSDPSSTLDAFMDDLEDYGDESIVIFAVSSQLINMLSARLDKLKIAHGLITGDQDPKEREMHMENFQAGRTQFILCTIAAGGTGITLTKGSTAVFLQRSWSMVENMQAEARVHRIGSERYDVIRIIDYVTRGTCQESVIQAVSEKSDQLQKILRDEELFLKFINGELSEKPEPKKEDE